jgi:hypothetical protein
LGCRRLRLTGNILCFVLGVPSCDVEGRIAQHGRFEFGAAGTLSAIDDGPTKIAPALSLTPSPAPSQFAGDAIGALGEEVGDASMHCEDWRSSAQRAANAGGSGQRPDCSPAR